jgi:hypothetical protein
VALAYLALLVTVFVAFGGVILGAWIANNAGGDDRCQSALLIGPR